MRGYLESFLLLALGTAFIGTAAFAGDDTSATVARDAAMKRAFQAMLNLQVLASTAEQFGSPQAREIIEKDLDALGGVKHEFPKSAKQADPAMAAILGSLADQIQETRSELRNGNVIYARHLARSTAGFCFGCHTRLPDAEGFEDASRRIEALNLPPFRKAEFFAATRQSDRALELYKKILLGKPEDAMDAVEYGRSLRHFVLLQVRVKQDPDGLVFNLAKVAGRKDLPDFIRTLAKAWQSDAKFWLEKDKVVTADLTGSALLKRAKQLVDRAAKLQAYPADGTGEVSLLRATGYLHEALGKSLSAKERGEALFLLGQGYRSLEDPSFTGLDSAFFEACIRENPKTDVALRCYRGYLRSFLLDPDRATDGERKRLAALRKLSE